MLLWDKRTYEKRALRVGVECWVIDSALFWVLSYFIWLKTTVMEWVFTLNYSDEEPEELYWSTEKQSWTRNQRVDPVIPLLFEIGKKAVSPLTTQITYDREDGEVWYWQVNRDHSEGKNEV
jgi:hypothetical protein